MSLIVKLLLGQTKVIYSYRQSLSKKACRWEVIFHYLLYNHFKENYQKFVRVSYNVENQSKINHNEIRDGSIWNDAVGDDRLQINFAWTRNTIAQSHACFRY